MLKIIGVRAAESNRRARQWSLITKIRRQEQWAICPALHFSDAEVWEVIRTEGMPYCELYDQGFNRLGCIAARWRHRLNAGDNLKCSPGMRSNIDGPLLDFGKNGRNHFPENRPGMVWKSKISQFRRPFRMVVAGYFQPGRLGKIRFPDRRRGPRR